jgi:hypothetical protein
MPKTPYKLSVIDQPSAVSRENLKIEQNLNSWSQKDLSSSSRKQRAPRDVVPSAAKNSIPQKDSLAANKTTLQITSLHPKSCIKNLSVEICKIDRIIGNF